MKYFRGTCKKLKIDLPGVGPGKSFKDPCDFQSYLRPVAGEPT